MLSVHWWVQMTLPITQTTLVKFWRLSSSRFIPSPKPSDILTSTQVWRNLLFHRASWPNHWWWQLLGWTSFLYQLESSYHISRTCLNLVFVWTWHVNQEHRSLYVPQCWWCWLLNSFVTALAKMYPSLKPKLLIRHVNLFLPYFKAWIKLFYKNWMVLVDVPRGSR